MTKTVLAMFYFWFSAFYIDKPEQKSLHLSVIVSQLPKIVLDLFSLLELTYVQTILSLPDCVVNATSQVHL